VVVKKWRWNPIPGPFPAGGEEVGGVVLDAPPYFRVLLLPPDMIVSKLAAHDCSSLHPQDALTVTVMV